MSEKRFGNTKISTIRRDFDKLARAIQEYDPEATEQIWDEKVSRWVDVAIGEAGKNTRPAPVPVTQQEAWHDISTLPSEYEDGRELLVADVDGEVHHVCWDNEFENWWPIRGHRPLEVDEVFFWMPLYKPPRS